jgi:thiol:disulfide interchange protein DsbC
MSRPAKALVMSLSLLAISSTSFATTKPDELVNKLSELAAPDKKAYGEQIKNSLAAKGQIKGIQEMPITKLFFVEAQQGSYLVSSDGRFVIEGVIKDVWHRKTIKSLEDARSTERLPLSNIGFKPEEQLASFTLGNPEIKRQGVIFVDPTSAITVTALQKINEKAESSNWTVVLMPLIGGDSAIDRSRRLWCATDKEGALKDLVNGTSESLSDVAKDCQEEPLVMGMMLTDLLQIRSLPHLIREDGLKSSGFPEKFDEWFKQP